MRKLRRRHHNVRFDGTELLLLAFMTVVLMGIVIWRMGLMPTPLVSTGSSVLGVAVGR